MSNGNLWIPEKHDKPLTAWAGRATDAEIGTITGHSARCIGEQRKRLNLPAFHPKRIGWSRRDYLMAGAAGYSENWA